MRIVYTNLTENDAGVKRSVRQFRVEFNGADGSAPEAPSATRAETDAGVLRAREPDSRPLSRPLATAAVEGAAALRSTLIKKFLDVQTGVMASDERGLSIIV